MDEWRNRRRWVTTAGTESVSLFSLRRVPSIVDVRPYRGTDPRPAAAGHRVPQGPCTPTHSLPVVCSRPLLVSQMPYVPAAPKRAFLKGRSERKRAKRASAVGDKAGSQRIVGKRSSTSTHIPCAEPLKPARSTTEVMPRKSSWEGRVGSSRTRARAHLSNAARI